MPKKKPSDDSFAAITEQFKLLNVNLAKVVKLLEQMNPPPKTVNRPPRKAKRAPRKIKI